MANILKKLYNADKRELKRFEKNAAQVESHADEMAALSDEELQAKTPEFVTVCKRVRLWMTCCLKLSP